MKIAIAIKVNRIHVIGHKGRNRSLEMSQFETNELFEPVVPAIELNNRKARSYSRFPLRTKLSPCFANRAMAREAFRYSLPP